MTGWLRADPLRAVLVAAALSTAAVGSWCLIAPAAALRGLGGDTEATSRLLLAAIGLLLVVIGGLLTHTLLGPQPALPVLVWSAAEKAGVFVVAVVGVVSGVFGVVALAVGIVDLITAVLLVLHHRRLRLRPMAIDAHAGRGARPDVESAPVGRQGETERVT